MQNDVGPERALGGTGAVFVSGRGSLRAMAGAWRPASCFPALSRLFLRERKRIGRTTVKYYHA
ncbi:MAG: hypothetical protein OXC72_00550 [Roseovarius sp.]|nr:hypothetical protein [Roseovarius sp.]